ncbi:hypothetical protein Acr_10g0008700 [Actinidia rufa]|uniref:Uncharacterized protein n=1 Tax=Actinidia rufa TaxID=165716 RepID=A0A7J0F9Z6_9ERIC|nr:hypothetical protein Acr_10g0008700 [Actinidia rufa]
MARWRQARFTSSSSSPHPQSDGETRTIGELGDLDNMAIKRTIGSTSSSAQHSSGEDNLIETPNIILQALPIFLMDYEEVGGILLFDPATHEIENKELAKVAKRVNGSWSEVTFLVSWLTILNQHYGNYVSSGRPISKNGEIDQHLPEQVQWEELIVCGEGDDLGDLRKETNVTGWGERPFMDGEWRVVREDHGTIIGQPSMEAVSKDLEKKKRLPYGKSTANVGDLVEMESQGHLILRVDDEVEMGEVHLILKFTSSSSSSHP